MGIGKILVSVGIAAYLVGIGFAAQKYRIGHLDKLESLAIQRITTNNQLKGIDSTLSKTKKGSQELLLNKKKTLQTQIAKIDSSINYESDEDHYKGKDFLKSFGSWVSYAVID